MVSTTYYHLIICSTIVFVKQYFHFIKKFTLSILKFMFFKYKIIYPERREFMIKNFTAFLAFAVLFMLSACSNSPASSSSSGGGPGVVSTWKGTYYDTYDSGQPGTYTMTLYSNNTVSIVATDNGYPGNGYGQTTLSGSYTLSGTTFNGGGSGTLYIVGTGSYQGTWGGTATISGGTSINGTVNITNGVLLWYIESIKGTKQ